MGGGPGVGALPGPTPMRSPDGPLTPYVLLHKCLSATPGFPEGGSPVGGSPLAPILDRGGRGHRDRHHGNDIHEVALRDGHHVAATAATAGHRGCGCVLEVEPG